MKRLWIGTTASLNRKWTEIRQDSPRVWLVRRWVRDDAAKAGRLAADSPVEFEWAHLCSILLGLAGIRFGKLFGEPEIFDVIRAALRDDRCASIPEFQGLQERPGMIHVLSDKLKRTASPAYADPDSKDFFADPALDRLRQVYREKLEKAGGIDIPGLFLRFLEEAQSVSLQRAIATWHSQLRESLGENYGLVIPCVDFLADDSEKLAKAVTQVLIDGFENLDLGLPIWPDDSPDRFRMLTEDWEAMGCIIDPIPIDEKSPESHFLNQFLAEPRSKAEPASNLRFVFAKDARAEIEAAVDHLSSLLEGGYDPTSIVIHSPQTGRFVEHLRDAINSAGIASTAFARPLIEQPLVRTVLDVAAALDQDWPCEALADLLRHPDFRCEGIVTEPDDHAVAGLAQEVERLGNVNGIGLILRFLMVRLDEKKASDRRTEADIGMALYYHEVLSRLDALLPRPLPAKNWTDRVAEFRDVVNRLFARNIQCDPALKMFWETLENDIGAAETSENSEWSWTEFYQEAHLRAESRNFLSKPVESKKVRIVTGDMPKDFAAGHLILVGMTEGHYPNRARVRRALRRPIPADLCELQAAELREFRQLIGSVSESLWISHHRRDDRGVETEVSGFLRKEVWSEVPPAAVSPALTLKPDRKEVLHGVEVARKRALAQLGPFNGMIEDEAIKGMLQSRFGPRYLFSPTSLEAASLCPFRFFGIYVLGLGAEEADDDLSTDYLTEGETVHSVLEELHRNRSVNSLAGESPTDFQETISRIIRDRHPCPNLLQESDFGRARWEVQNRRIEHRLATYVGQVRRDLSPPSPGSRGNGKINANTEFDSRIEVLRCEVRAGDTDDRLQPLEIQDEITGMSLRIGGRIDRIDGERIGPLARVRLVDYKTGSAIREGQIRDMLHLQLPIYAMMSHARQFAGTFMEVKDIGFWYLKRSKGGYSSIREWINEGGPLDISRMRDNYEPFLLKLARRIRSGFFPVRPREYGCERRCPLGEVCRIRELRAVRHRSRIETKASVDR